MKSRGSGAQCLPPRWWRFDAGCPTAASGAPPVTTASPSGRANHLRERECSARLRVESRDCISARARPRRGVPAVDSAILSPRPEAPLRLAAGELDVGEPCRLRLEVLLHQPGGQTERA